MIRTAIIFLYIQIFPLPPFKIACYMTLGVNIAFGVSAVIADCLICRPITYRWAPSMVNGSCGDQKSFDLYVAVMNLLLDVELVILPMPIVWGLKMARCKKTALSGIFGIGVMYGSQPDFLAWYFQASSTDACFAVVSVPSPFTASKQPLQLATQQTYMRKIHTVISRS